MGDRLLKYKTCEKLVDVTRRIDVGFVGSMTSYYREVGSFQIFLAYPSNKGESQVLERAELVQKHFARGTTLTEGAIEVNILRTPQIAGSTIAGDRVIVPVIIQYSAGVLQ